MVCTSQFPKLKCVQIDPSTLSALGRAVTALALLSRFHVAARQRCSSTGKNVRQSSRAAPSNQTCNVYGKYEKKWKIIERLFFCSVLFLSTLAVSVYSISLVLRLKKFDPKCCEVIPSVSIISFYN